VPGVARELVRPADPSGLRYVAAGMAVVGWPVFQLFTLAPPPVELNYNNAVWFFVQSKHMLWLFALEPVRRWATGRVARWVVGVGVAALAVPSTVEYFVTVGPLLRAPGVPRRYDPEEAALTRRLARRCPAGSVVLAGPDTPVNVPVFTRCRVPAPTTATEQYSWSFMTTDALNARLADVRDFWADWSGGRVRTDLLDRYAVDYLVVDRSQTVALPDGAAGLDPQPVIDIGRFVVYRTIRSAP
jgi:hypothetical protein